jgi:subtilase family serine protease
MSRIGHRRAAGGCRHHIVVGLASLTAGATALFGLAVPAGASEPAAAAAPARVGQAPKITAGAAYRGPLGGSASLRVDVELRPRDPAALAAYATAVSTPGDPLYQRYLPRGAFAGRFGPTDAAVAAVRSSLDAAGLKVGTISANHLTLPVTGSVARLDRAFSISVGSYRLPGGRVAFANNRAPLFAGAVAPDVLGVVGLDDLNLPQRLGAQRVTAPRPMAASPHVVTGGPQPCSAAVSAAPGQDAYTADQIASAYRFSSLYGAGDEGAGVTVALFELEPNLASDISAYQSCYGTSATVNYIKEDGGAGSGAGAGEAALDIEDVIGLAPKATVDVYQAPNSNTGLIDNYTAIVDSDTAKSVSTSWGGCESASGSTIISEEGTLFEQAATQGQSVFAAAGDNGSEDCDTSALAVDDPASQPYVTGVGGTSLTAIGPAPTQTVWNESANGAGAGGGGISSSHTMPSYQSGASSSLNVINSHSSASPCRAASGSYCREVPDVSADADPYTGYLIYYDGSWSGIGGTSAAAPLWAAFTALVDASTSCAGKPVGFANPKLYSAAASAYSADFNDITSGNNDYTPSGYSGGLYPAGTAYDMASGLGTPNGASLPATLCGGGSTTGNTVTVTNPGNQSTTVGTAVKLQVSATDSGGASLTYSATGLPAGLSISSSGLISGTPTTAATDSVTVTAKDSTGASGSTSFTWTVSSASSCPAKQLLLNPGFESGSADWSATSDVILSNSEAGGGEVAQAGSWFAWLDGYGTPHTDTLAQKVAVPAGCTVATLTYYQHIDTSEAGSSAIDTLKLQVLNASGAVVSNVSTYSNVNAASGYQKVTVNLGSYAGQTVSIKWTGVETDTGGGTTDFCVDTAALNVT